MKLVMIRELYSKDWWMNKDKIILGLGKDNRYITLAYLDVVRRDFNENDENLILDNNDSIQIRPKAIYHNHKGYYRILEGKRCYYDSTNIVELEEGIEKFKKYLKNKE